MPIVLVPKQKFKTCARCEIEKPLTEFYTRQSPPNTKKRPHSYCIECTKYIAKHPVRYKEKPSPAEMVLPILHKFGYPAETTAHNDILLYGCLKVCVKKSRKHKRMMRVFFTDRQLAENYDMIVVIAPDGSIIAYSWLDSVWLDKEFQTRFKTKVLPFGRNSLLAETIETELHKKRVQIALGEH